MLEENYAADVSDASVMLNGDVSVKRKKHPKDGKSSKKKRKQLLVYENLYKDQMLGELHNDRDEEELELEELVFGGEFDILDGLNSEPSHKTNENKHHKIKKKPLENGVGKCSNDSSVNHVERQPAWDDDDDDNILVNEKAETWNNCHRSVSNRKDEKYKYFAREKFLKITGKPRWAELDNKGKTADSDEDSEEELLQKTGNIILRSASLPKTKIEVRKCGNLTEEDTNRGIVKSVEFHPMSKVALVAGFSGMATLYQVDGKNNSKIQAIGFSKFPIYTAHFSADGNEFVVGSKDFGHFFTYDMIAGKIRRIPWEKGMEQQNIRRFHMSPDGKFMVVHGHFGNINLLHAKSKEWVESLKMNGEVLAITFNVDGSRMYSHGDTGEVYVWDMNSRQCVHKFYDEGCIAGTAIAVSPNNTYLATGSDTGVVNIYETSSLISSSKPTPARVFLNLTTEVTSLKYNHSSEILAMASSHKLNSFKLVHFPSMKVFPNFPAQQNKLHYINSLDISLNSGYLLFGNNKGSAYLYRLRHYSNY